MIERDMYFADEKARKRYQITNIITKILLFFTNVLHYKKRVEFIFEM